MNVYKEEVYTCNIYLQSAKRAMLVDVTLVFIYRALKVYLYSAQGAQSLII